MNKKYIILIVSIIVIIAIVIAILFKTNLIGIEVSNNQNVSASNTNNNDVIPEEEISDEQMRNSKIKLYFEGEDGNLVEETRDIDVKELINDPYRIIITLLIDGPKDEKNKKLIPEETSLISTERVGDVLEINFSNEFLKNAVEDKKKQELIIDSILKSVMELREINGIRILINGEKVDSFNNNGYKLSDIISSK